MKVNKPKSNKIAIYVRVSTREAADDGLSIDNQIDRSIEYINDTYGSTKKYEIYNDAGMSSKKLTMSSLIKLISDIENGLIDLTSTNENKEPSEI